MPRSACPLLGNTMLVYDVSTRHPLAHKGRPEYSTDSLAVFRHGHVGTSQVPVRPQLSVRTCSLTPVGSLPQTILRASNVVPGIGTAETPAINFEFRGSIARHSDWLFTLHREDYSLPMQNSLPAVGQTLPGRLFLQGSLRKVLTC